MLWCSLRFPHKNDVLNLQLFVGWLMSYLRYLCLLAHSSVQHILCCVFALFVFVSCIPCCQFFWIVYFWLPLRYSLKFISYIHMHSMSKFLSYLWGAVYQNFHCSAFYSFCFALLFYLCALFCALLCRVFMFHCIMYYLLCNLIVHAWYLWTCMCYLCLYVNVLYVFM